MGWSTVCARQLPQSTVGVLVVSIRNNNNGSPNSMMSTSFVTLIVLVIHERKWCNIPKSNPLRALNLVPHNDSAFSLCSLVPSHSKAYTQANVHSWNSRISWNSLPEHSYGNNAHLVLLIFWLFKETILWRRNSKWNNSHKSHRSVNAWTLTRWIDRCK